MWYQKLSRFIRGLSVRSPSKTHRPPLQSNRAPVDAIRDAKWRQGSLLPRSAYEAVGKLVGIAIPEEAACVVVTQSCCLLHGVLENEPYAEIVVAFPTPLDGLYTFGKNIRKIHFPIAEDEDTKNFEIAAAHRYLIPREFLAGYVPDPTRNISEDDLRGVIGWVVARYQREALPDQFQKRISPIKKKLRKQVIKLEDVSDILIELRPFDELPDETNYEVSLTFVMPDSAYAIEQSRMRAEQAVQGIRDLLSNCRGIELVDDVLRSDAEVTIQDLRTLRRWGDFDYVSYEGDG